MNTTVLQEGNSRRLVCWLFGHLEHTIVRTDRGVADYTAQCLVCARIARYEVIWPRPGEL